jgi:hypothetical protein
MPHNSLLISYWNFHVIKSGEVMITRGHLLSQLLNNYSADQLTKNAGINLSTHFSSI